MFQLFVVLKVLNSSNIILLAIFSISTDHKDISIMSTGTEYYPKFVGQNLDPKYEANSQYLPKTQTLP